MWSSRMTVTLQKTKLQNVCRLFGQPVTQDGQCFVAREIL